MAQVSTHIIKGPFDATSLESVILGRCRKAEMQEWNPILRKLDFLVV